MEYLKFFGIRYLVFVVLFFGLFGIINLFFLEWEETLRIGIPAIAAVILSPRIKHIETEEGRKLQLNSLFSKEPLLTQK